jgi:pimeloyl-ACP methyl ester carboxylesterase
LSNVIRSCFVNASGIKTHYSESGNNGPVIVALHGGGAGSSGEAGFAPVLSRLNEYYRFVALDSVGGFGRTDVQAPTPYGIKSRVDHLEAFVDALCLDRFTVLGNSQGAWAAARYATFHPEQIERLILVGSATIAQAFGVDVPITEEMKTLLSFDGTREGMRTAIKSLFYDKSQATDDLVELRYTAAMRPGAAESMARAATATQRLQSDPILRPIFDLSKALPAFSKVIPTIFIWGEDDHFATPEMGRQVEKRLPDVKFHWVPKAGHQVQADQPEKLVEIIEAFMASTPPARW